MTRITVSNPYYGKTYQVNETVKKVKNSIFSTNDYDDRFAVFNAINEYGNEITLTIKASNFASIEIEEEKEN